MNKPSLCFVGLDNYPLMDLDFSHLYFGGESVQQALIAKAFAGRDYQVSMVVKNHGQPREKQISGVRCISSYADGEGLPVVRFIYPKIFKVWRALKAADADIYYQSCADMLTGVVAAYCKMHGKKFIYRLANDQDAEPHRLKMRFARDRAMYKWGLRHADSLMPQTAYQNDKLKENFSLSGPIIKMIVESPSGLADEKVDVLWVNNVRPHKRADRIYAIAKALPDIHFCMIGGPVPGYEDLYQDIVKELQTLDNVTVKGLTPYAEAEKFYASCKVFINTSDMEGFPNAFLQALSIGKPIVSLFDPDNLIEKRKMGLAVKSDEEFPIAIQRLLSDENLYNETAKNGLAYIAENHSDQAVVSSIIEVIDGL